MQKGINQNNTLRTKEQNGRLHVLLSQLNMTEYKADLAASFSNGRTESTSELTVYECKRLIEYLTRLIEGKSQATPQYATDKANKMRRKILSICHEMQWEHPSGSIDWERLNSWLMKYGYLHKSLNAYTEKELPKLLTQFDNLLKSFYGSGKD